MYQMTSSSSMDTKNFNPWNRGNGMARYFGETSPITALYGQMNRLFSEFLHDFDHSRGSNLSSSTRWPNIEITETDKDIKILAELPGIDEKEVSVSLRDGVLTLKGEQKCDSNGSIYSERSHGKFERSIQLGSEIDPEKATTSFKNGVLTIAFAKRPDSQKQVKRILVGRESSTHTA